MRKILISLLSIIFIISIMTNVYAATGSITSGASSDTVVKGKTFTVTLAATSDSPIDGMYTKFNYDKNVLEVVSATPGENYGSDSSGEEILIKNNSSSTSPTTATLYTITFKVLDNANVENTTITFSESALHLNVGDTLEEKLTTIEEITINVKADDTTVGNQGTQGEGNNTQTDEPKNTTTTPSNTTDSGDKSNTTSKPNTNNKKNTSSKNTATKLPQTGVETASLLAIVALGAISIVSYVSYRKYKNI